MKEDIYEKDFLSEKGTYLQDVFHRHFSKLRTQTDPLSKLLYVDTKTWLPDRLLLKADKMTMATSVELRFPFLDHRIVEYCASLPYNYKYRKGDGKYILKCMASQKLPKGIVQRKKAGFPLPTQNWFSCHLFNALEERLLNNDSFPWLNNSVINKFLKEHKLGKQDHSNFIMTLLVLDSWREEYA